MNVKHKIEISLQKNERQINEKEKNMKFEFSGSGHVITERQFAPVDWATYLMPGVQKRNSINRIKRRCSMYYFNCRQRESC